VKAFASFAHQTLWDADYLVGRDQDIRIAGYRGPLPITSRARETVAATIGAVLHEQLGSRLSMEQAIRAVARSDRLMVAWDREKAAAVVTARHVTIDDLTGWYVTAGAVRRESVRKGLFTSLIRVLVTEEPADFLAGTTNRDAVVRAYRTVAPHGSLEAAPVPASSPISVLGRRILTAALDTSTAEHLGPDLVRRDCYPETDDSASVVCDGVELGPRDGLLVVRDLSGATRRRVGEGPTGLSGVAGEPLRVVAVTGTNGKTTVVEAGRQLSHAAGRRAASLGTLGVVTDRGRIRRARVGIGPDAVAEHAYRLWESGTEVLWTEAFSYPLGRGLLDSLPVDVAVFTHAGVDHVGAHGSLAAYLRAKERLFETILREDGVAVVDPRAPGAGRILEIAARRGTRSVTTGPGGAVEFAAGCLRVGDRRHPCNLPFEHDGMIGNLELAVGAAVALGLEEASLAEACDGIITPPGRFEVLDLATSFRIIVDAAHNADALESSLRHLRCQTRGRLLVLVGSVGTSDWLRWETLGEVADVMADVVVVTDESPYQRDPKEIRDAIRRGCPRGRDIADRRVAIDWLLGEARSGDTVVICGRADEDFVVDGRGKRPYPSDDALVRSSWQERSRGKTAPETRRPIRAG
jgi:UDP-N-acetylmuramoyl-L-alanyl-D-glutamate--2,6-diaminopimelate ligase